MIMLASIIYKYNGCIEQKWVNPDKYGYLDVVSDIYNSVLKHIPKGRTVSFLVKCILPDGIQELEVESDQAVMNLLSIYDLGDTINIIVYNVHVSEHTTSDYTINGYPSSLVSRDNPSGSQGGELEIDSTVESDADRSCRSDATVVGNATGRVSKAPVRSGAATSRTFSRSVAIGGRGRCTATSSSTSTVRVASARAVSTSVATASASNCKVTTTSNSVVTIGESSIKLGNVRASSRSTTTVDGCDADLNEGREGSSPKLGDVRASSRSTATVDGSGADLDAGREGSSTKLGDVRACSRSTATVDGNDADLDAGREGSSIKIGVVRASSRSTATVDGNDADLDAGREGSSIKIGDVRASSRSTATVDGSGADLDEGREGSSSDAASGEEDFNYDDSSDDADWKYDGDDGIETSGKAAPGDFRKRARSVQRDTCKEADHSRTSQRAPVKEEGKRKQMMESQETNPPHTAQVKGKGKRKQVMESQEINPPHTAQVQGEGKRMQMMGREEDINTSQRETRSQAPVAISHDSVQAKHRARMAAKQARRKKRTLEAIGK